MMKYILADLDPNYSTVIAGTDFLLQKKINVSLT